LLGAGGMGEVYRAHDTNPGCDVAVKALPAEFAHDAGGLARFRREARALALLNHPNIAAIYGLEESAEADYLVLELVEGETPHGPLPLATVLDYACQIAGALRAAHEHDVVHRDLKPSNLKVTAQSGCWTSASRRRSGAWRDTPKPSMPPYQWVTARRQAAFLALRHR
jgi:serine/threonine protein kinase